MNTYQERVNEIRRIIDIEINERGESYLSSPELVKKALLVEQELSSKN